MMTNHLILRRVGMITILLFQFIFRILLLLKLLAVRVRRSQMITITNNSSLRLVEARV
jgi:hypothetical protein